MRPGAPARRKEKPLTLRRGRTSADERAYGLPSFRAWRAKVGPWRPRAHSIDAFVLAKCARRNCRYKTDRRLSTPRAGRASTAGVTASAKRRSMPFLADAARTPMKNCSTACLGAALRRALGPALAVDVVGYADRTATA